MENNIDKERALRIKVTMPNNKVMTFSFGDFDDFGDTLEHKTENIILDKEDPRKSCVYETDFNGEIIYKNYISWQI